MSSNLFTSGVASYCAAAFLASTPTIASSNTDYIPDVNKLYYNIEKTMSNTTNSTVEVKISKNIDIYELEADTIISKIEEIVGISIDDKFIPNKSEENTTLFITCKEFRDFCENEKYQEAYDLELKIKSSLEEELINFDKIGRVAFL